LIGCLRAAPRGEVRRDQDLQVQGVHNVRSDEVDEEQAEADAQKSGRGVRFEEEEGRVEGRGEKQQRDEKRGQEPLQNGEDRIESVVILVVIVTNHRINVPMQC
jgi:hypothetical protein